MLFLLQQGAICQQRSYQHHLLRIAALQQFRSRHGEYHRRRIGSQLHRLIPFLQYRAAEIMQPEHQLPNQCFPQI
ncbi:hypothetical protein D3C80_1844940 [compost metagenome]